MKSTRLGRTAAAIGSIRSAQIRRDFEELAKAAQAGLAARDIRHTSACLKTIVHMAFGLNRTISPTVALNILKGVIDDANRSGISERSIGVRAPVERSYFNPGGVGSGRCRRDPGGTCIHLSGGCGGSVYPVGSGLVGFRMHEPRPPRRKSKTK